MFTGLESEHFVLAFAVPPFPFELLFVKIVRWAS